MHGKKIILMNVNLSTVIAHSLLHIKFHRASMLAGAKVLLMYIKNVESLPGCTGTYKVTLHVCI